jgi:quercetin dioxygenase-like cupin family protein
MNPRSFGTTLIAFCLGAAAYWAVSTHTSWLHFLHKRSEFHAIKTNEMEWVAGGKGGPASYSMKYLHKDVDTGEVAMLVRYPAGQKQPPHTHSYGHGIYVLQGKLVTHKGTYGPGAFVWFPPDEVIEHGASPDEDLVILFLRHEDMDIHYLQAATSH